MFKYNFGSDEGRWRMAAIANVDVAKMRRASAKAGRLLRALGNEDRLLLLCELSQEELCVSDLAERTGLQQPSLSQQLGVLRAEAVVDTRREGRNIVYRVADANALAVLKTLHRIFCEEKPRGR